jgi:SPP1 gp7 family putative phage head morphogenesis protein
MARRVASPVRSQKMLENKYKVELNKLGRAMIKAVRERVLSYLKTNEELYVVDTLADQIELIFATLNRDFTGTLVATFANSTATNIINTLNNNNKRRFNKSIESVTGVDLGNIIQVEGLQSFVDLNINKNVSLIKSLPEEYLKEVETIVSNGLVSGARYSTIANQITAKVGSSNSKLAGRIKTIARNEIQTINAQFNLRRSESLGITKGIYRTSEDESVRPCHAELNGVEYELAKGAWSKTCKKFIQPGITDINCRCDYSPIIEE